MKKTISVIGSADPSKKDYDFAYKLGELIGEKDLVLVCGGLGGIMEAVSKGVKSAGGITVGILPEENKQSINPYIDIPIVTGMGEARNIIIALTADVVIAVGGELGTLSELAISMKHKKPVIGLNTWDLDREYCKKVNIIEVYDPQEAIDKAISLIR